MPSSSMSWQCCKSVDMAVDGASTDPLRGHSSDLFESTASGVSSSSSSSDAVSAKKRRQKQQAAGSGENGDGDGDGGGGGGGRWGRLDAIEEADDPSDETSSRASSPPASPRPPSKGQEDEDEDGVLLKTPPPVRGGGSKTTVDDVLATIGGGSSSPPSKDKQGGRRGAAGVGLSPPRPREVGTPCTVDESFSSGGTSTNDDDGSSSVPSSLGDSPILHHHHHDRRSEIPDVTAAGANVGAAGETATAAIETLLHRSCPHDAAFQTASSAANHQLYLMEKDLEQEWNNELSGLSESHDDTFEEGDDGGNNSSTSSLLGGERADDDDCCDIESSSSSSEDDDDDGSGGEFDGGFLVLPSLHPDLYSSRGPAASAAAWGKGVELDFDEELEDEEARAEAEAEAEAAAGKGAAIGSDDDNVGKALVVVTSSSLATGPMTDMNNASSNDDDADVSSESNELDGLVSDNSGSADELNLSGFNPPESHALVVAGGPGGRSGSGSVSDLNDDDDEDHNGPLQIVSTDVVGDNGQGLELDLALSVGDYDHLDRNRNDHDHDDRDDDDCNNSFDFSTAFSSVFSSDADYSTDDTRPFTNRDRKAAARIKRKIRRRDRAIAELRANQEVLAEEAAKSGRDKVAVAMWYQSLLTDVVKQRVTEAKAEASELRTERDNLARDVEERDLWLKDLASERDGLREDVKKSKTLVRTYKSIVQKLAVKEEERVSDLTEGHRAEVETLRRMLEEKDERIQELTAMAAAASKSAKDDGDALVQNGVDSRHSGSTGAYDCASHSMEGDSSYLNRRLNLSSAPAVSIDEEDTDGYTRTTTTDEDYDDGDEVTSRDFESSAGGYTGFADNSAVTSDDEWTAGERHDPNNATGAFPTAITNESPLGRMRRSGHVTVEGLTAVGPDDDEMIGMPREAMVRMQTQMQRVQLAQMAGMDLGTGAAGGGDGGDLDLTVPNEERQHLLSSLAPPSLGADDDDAADGNGGADADADAVLRRDVPAAVVAVSPSPPPPSGPDQYHRQLQYQQQQQQQLQHAGSDTSEAAQRAHVAAVAAMAVAAAEEEREASLLAAVAVAPPSDPSLALSHRQDSTTQQSHSRASSGVPSEASSRHLEMHQRYCDMISELQSGYLEKCQTLDRVRIENDALRNKVTELEKGRERHMEELAFVQRNCSEMVAELKASRARLCHELEEHLQDKDREIEELTSANAAQAKLLQSTRQQSADASAAAQRRSDARAELEQLEEVRRLNEMYTSELADLRRSHRVETAALRQRGTETSDELERCRRETDVLRRRLESMGTF